MHTQPGDELIALLKAAMDKPPDQQRLIDSYRVPSGRPTIDR
jgi:hypothetical protein